MTLVGRLGTDPEVQQSANGGSFVKYSVGTSYGPKDNRQTSWFRVAAFPPEGSAQREYVMGLGKGYVQQLFYSAGAGGGPGYGVISEKPLPD
jgi:single-stranded DNA-binding protein